VIRGRGLSTFNLLNFSTITGIEARHSARIVQFIFHPSGGAINPTNAESHSIPGAAVFGVRTVSISEAQMTGCPPPAK
jgi:hypothetical protein